MANKLQVDRLDLKIMSALQRDGRTTKAELSKTVGLSATPCCMRIAKLEAAGLIKGYHADIDMERLGGLSEFLVTVGFREWTPDRAKQFEELVADIPHIVECNAVFGSIDYVMRVMAADARHYQEVMEPLLVIELDYTTYPVSRTVRDIHAVPTAGLLSAPLR